MPMKSKKVAFGGVVAALSLVLMLLTGVFPFGTYALPCMAGLLLTFIVIEFSSWWAIGVYFAVSVLSFFLAADKEAALYYILLLGIYPVLKSFFEKIKFKWLSFVIKLLYFNVSAVCSYFISIYILAIPEDSFELFGVNLPLVFLLAGNVVFVVYDIAVSRIAFLYLAKFRNMFK